MWKKIKLLKMSNFTLFHIVFYPICILKSFNSHISVVVCSFFEFGKVSKLGNGLNLGSFRKELTGKKQEERVAFPPEPSIA